MAGITSIVTTLARPVVESLGLELWDVSFGNEGGRQVLRIVIDRQDGVSIEDCEAVSNALDPVLDEADPIAQSYVLQVSSAGLDRELKRDSDFARFMGSRVSVKLYVQLFGAREHIGVLSAFDENSIELDGTKAFPRKQAAQVRLYVEV